MEENASGTGGPNSQVRENINRFNNPQSDTRNNSGRSFADAANIPRVEVTEPSGTIQQQRPRRQGLIMGNNRDTNIQGVEKNFAADVQLAATGINKDVTAEDMENWLKGKGLNAKCSIETKQNVWEEVRKITMKVTIPANETDKAKDLSIWPYRVFVRLWREDKKKRNDQRQELGTEEPRDRQQGNRGNSQNGNWTEVRNGRGRDRFYRGGNQGYGYDRQENSFLVSRGGAGGTPM